jgi:hypothetical protein
MRITGNDTTHFEEDTGVGLKPARWQCPGNRALLVGHLANC